VFDDNSVGDSGNRFAFVKTDFGKHGAGRYKEDTFPKAGHDTGKNIGGKYRGCTATAAAAGMCILFLVIVYQQTTVLMDG